MRRWSVGMRPARLNSNKPLSFERKSSTNQYLTDSLIGTPLGQEPLHVPVAMVVCPLSGRERAALTPLRVGLD